jgi:hypothetical protein
MDLGFIVEHGVMYGLVLSVLVTLIFLIAAPFNPEVLLNDYPPDVKAAYGREKNPWTRLHRRIFSLAMLGALFGILGYSVFSMERISPVPLTYLPLLLLLFVEIFTFNLWDLLVIDWLVFNTLQPKFIFLPGTEGMAGYRNYSFHFQGFLTGIVFSLVSSLVLAGMALMIVTAIG